MSTIKCPNCQSNLTVEGQGTYACPECSSEFKYKGKKTILLKKSSRKLSTKNPTLILWILSIIGILLSLILMIASSWFGLLLLLVSTSLLPPILRWISSKTHLRIRYIIIILFVIIMVGFGFSLNSYTPSDEYTQEQARLEQERKLEELEKIIAEAKAINEDYPEELDGLETSVKGAQDANVALIDAPDDKTFQVLEVVDGDTIKVSDLGTIRLIGIDTPETVDPRKEVQCFGKEASNKAKELLEGESVRLEFDSSQGRVDKYGRTLAYVFRGDDLFFNLEMVKQGYAHEYTYSTPYKYQSEFKEAEKEAESSKKGLWGDSCKCEKGEEVSRSCTGCNELTITKSNWDCSTYTEKITSSSCSYKCTTSVPKATTQPESTTQPKTTTQPESATQPKTSSCLYSCSSPDRDCADFKTHAQAVAFFKCCGFTATNDPMRLDGMGVDDGDPCESLP